MKIQDIILSETPSDDTALITIANAIAPFLSKQPNDVPSSHRLDTLIADAGLQHLQVELPKKMSSITIRIAKLEDAATYKVRASWTGSTATIHLGIPDGRTAKAIASSLAHELRHALDDYKALEGSNSLKWANTPFNQYSRPTANYANEFIRYQSSPNETNARYVEAMALLADDIEQWKVTPPSSQEIQAAVLRVFEEKIISQYFPQKEKSPQYKRLINRAVSHIQHNLVKPSP